MFLHFNATLKYEYPKSVHSHIHLFSYLNTNSCYKALYLDFTDPNSGSWKWREECSLISGTSIGNHHKGGETTTVGVTVSDIVYPNFTLWKILNTTIPMVGGPVTGIPILGSPVTAIPLGFTILD